MTRSDSFSLPVWIEPAGDDVLRLQRGDQRRAVDAEAGQLLGGELDEDPLVLRAEDFDLGDIRHMQQARAHVLDIVAQFALGEAIRGEAVDDAEGVAEVVVEAGPEMPAGSVWRMSPMFLRT